MATANRSGLIPGKAGVDFVDAVIAPFFVLATFVMSELVSVSVNDPFTLDLSEPILAFSGSEVSIALVITAISLLAAWLSNEARDMDDYNREQLAIVGAMLLLNFGSAFIPAISDALSQFWYVGALMVVINGAAFYLIAYY